ncbi:MAG: RagB/SusD family nutrient uptake outer membrane protein [Ferruginibacter sp.]|nr:RagB/SusD family nutrient uptake outer membrane protein [Ferruginibacter sp.]
MKKYFNKITIALAACVTLAACHKLELPVTTQLTPDNFPSTEQHFIQAAGPTYIAFRANYATQYWFLQSISTDEAIMPARGGNWYDGSRYEQLAKHTWNKDNGFLNDTWNWLTSVISNSNQNLFLIDKSAESDAKNRGTAELKTMRAIAYFMMMDIFGNVPIVTKFGDTNQPATTPRKDVFAFIEKEVLESLPFLSDVTGAPTYGRPNKFTSYALLAKMYLNSEVYTGTPKYTDAVTMCDNIISSNKFAIENNYLSMFRYNNGPAIKEFIFAIPYDPAAGGGQMFYPRYNLYNGVEMRNKYSLNYTPSGPMSTLPEFYAYFNEPNDIRTSIWLTGKQYYFNGSPILINTTKKGYDEDYAGADAGAPLSYHLEFTPNIVIKKPAVFDCGNDLKAWSMGYRCNKFYPDSTSTSRNQNTDLPVFRYADILLMKAEAILRGAPATNGQTALSLVNEIRTKRNAVAWTAVTLQTLYEERSRELVSENWHRNDMIRFGKFEGSWGVKTDNDVQKRIFAIPLPAIQLNGKLTQNPGY